MPEYSEYAICEDLESQVSHLMQVCENQREELQRLRADKVAADEELNTFQTEGCKVQAAYEEKLEEVCDLEKQLAYLQARFDEQEGQLAHVGDVSELERTYNNVLRSNQSVLDEMRRTARERESMVSEDWRSAVAFRLSSRPAPVASAPVAPAPVASREASALEQEVSMLKAVSEAKDKVIEAKNERIAELQRTVGGETWKAATPAPEGWSPKVCFSHKPEDREPWTSEKDTSRKLLEFSTVNQTPRTALGEVNGNMPSESKLRRPSSYGPSPKPTPRASAQRLSVPSSTTPTGRVAPQRVRIR